MKFFNREKEVKEIIHILNKEPDDIYFIYGSINSGKTTLINHIINEKLKELDKKYAIFYVNFREYDVYSMDNFVEALFEIDENSKSSKMKPYIESFTKGLNNAISIYYGIKIPEPLLDRLFGEKEKGRLVFKFIRDLFISLNNKGIQPVFILDELQMIRDIAMNGGRPLLKSLFQFLVSLTKERHLAHCLCLTSDSLFAEYVYNTGELEGRAKHLLVDDFDKITSFKYMDSLAKENEVTLSNNHKEKIYSYVGGKPKDIKYVIEECRVKDLDEILELLLKNEEQRLKYFLEDVSEEYENLYEKIINALQKFKKGYEVEDLEIPKKIREILIKRNILFLNPQKGTLKPQSFLVWNAIKKVV